MGCDYAGDNHHACSARTLRAVERLCHPPKTVFTMSPMPVPCSSPVTAKPAKQASGRLGTDIGGTRRLSCIDPLVERYDAFLVDQFGTLHDGVAPYPGAIDALRKMRAAGCRVGLLSNSGRSAQANARRLASMGFGHETYDFVLTSGELAIQMAAAHRLRPLKGVQRCLWLERPGEETIMDRFGLDSVGPEHAELIIIAGSEGDRFQLAHYEKLLFPLARRGVPALCLNPDRIMLTPSGKTFGAGKIAETYAAMGGEVTWIGKPYPDLYEAALEMLGYPDPGRVAGIGDSLEHDIAGASGAGCEGWLVRKGIIEGWSEVAIVAECARWLVVPTGLLEALT